MRKEDLRVGDHASVSKTLTETDVYNFAGICGDFNPLHVNAAEAKKSRFGQRVCHGALVASFISTVLGMYLPGPGSILLEEELKFVAPTYIGDTVMATVVIKEIVGRIVTLDASVVNQRAEKVISGSAKVMI